jgi:hypothetical protein
VSLADVRRPEPRDRYRLTEERVARALRVPYWLISSRPRPSWLQRPIWRLREFLWRRWV